LLELKEISKSTFISKNMQTFQYVIIEEFDGEFSVGYTANYIKVYLKGELKPDKYKVLLTAKFKDGALAEIQGD
jgi:hypothetical protein